MNEKEKRWVDMGMSVGKRWGVLDESNYIWKKGNKVESTHANRVFFSFIFFFWEEENRESKNLCVIPRNVAHSVNLSYIFYF